MKSFLHIAVLALCAFQYCRASSVSTHFVDCTPVSTNYDATNPIRAVVDYHDVIGATLSWNICMSSPAPLLRVRSAKLQITDNQNKKMLTNSHINICHTANSCIQNIRANNCIQGHTELEWIHPPRSNVTEKLLLQDVTGNTIAELCAV